MQVRAEHLAEIVECLRELGDAEYQQRVWIRGEGDEVSSFAEATCRLFDDTGLGDLLEKRDTVISPEADAVLSRLSDSLDSFDEMTDEQILRSRRWPAVRRLALQAIEVINDLRAAAT